MLERLSAPKYQVVKTLRAMPNQQANLIRFYLFIRFLRDYTVDAVSPSSSFGGGEIPIR